MDPDLFEAAGAQLDENRQRKRDGRRRRGWLLQGLAVCRRCGYAFYGKMARGMVGGRQLADYGYYRCIGTDAHKFGGHAPCDNRAIRSDKLEAAVWREVEAVLDDPQRVTAEHERRTAVAQDGGPNADLDTLDRQIARLQRGIDRLIDGYADEVISADEFRPRVAGLKQRLDHLRAERDAVATVEAANRGLHLVIGLLEEFAKRVHAGLDGLDWYGRREIILPSCVGSKLTATGLRLCSAFLVRSRPAPGEAEDQDQRTPIRRAGIGNIVGRAIVRLVGALIFEQSNEWATQPSRYMTLETMTAVSDTPAVSLTVVAA